MFDLLIKNGLVFDGSGSPGFESDVAVEGGRIVAIGDLKESEAKTVIDASGKAVTPGFIDMHSHADFTLPAIPTADSMVHQGITTLVAGQCGSSPVPLLDETRDVAISALDNADLPIPWDELSTFESYIYHLQEIGISPNVVMLVGQGVVRGAVMGFSAEPATPGQIAQMQEEVIKAMDAGAIGVSTGLIYPPGSYSNTEELIELVRPVGERGGYYFSHIRGEDTMLLEAIAEAIHIGEETGAAVQISHLKAAGQLNWSKAEKALELIDQARGRGLDVASDMYPYMASSTGLSVLIPEWAHEGGHKVIMERLADPTVRQRIKSDPHMERVSAMASWDKVMICRASKMPEYEGRSIAELADAADSEVADWIMDALLATELDADILPFIMSEENIKMQLAHPALMIGCDGTGLIAEGPLAKGVPHPRSYGTFPRVLARYVREEKVLSLEQAIYKMTGLAAERLRWTDRGLLKEGFYADLVVFDPETVADKATYQAPHQYAAGIEHVLVNGVPVICDGNHTGSRPGKLLS